MRITDVTDVTRHAQDPIYMQDLGKIKTLLEEGVLTEVEFNTKKAELIKQRKERKAATEGVGGGGAPVPWCQAGEETTDRIKGLEAQVARLQAALAERDKTVEELQRRGGAKAPSATVRRGSGVCGGSEAPLYFGYFRKHPQCSAGKLLRTQPTVPKAVFDGVSTNSHVRDISVSALVARVDTMCNSLQAEKPIVGGAKHGALTAPGKGAVTLCKGARGADADEGTTRKDVEDAQRVCPLLKKPSVSETSLPIRSARSGRCRNMCAGMYACMRARASPPCETSRRQRGQSCKVDATESSDMADTTSDEDCFTD